MMMRAISDILAAAKCLSARQKEVLYETITKHKMPLTDRELIFVAEYMVDFDGPRAASAAGYRHPYIIAKRILDEKRSKRIMLAIQDCVEARQNESRLTADYVRDYIRSVLDFCPTDWFVPSENGMTLIEQEKYETLPIEVKRMVESVELKNVRGQWLLSLKFISKSAALAMAARYTLVQKHEATVTATIPWDKLALGVEVGVDPLNARIVEIVSAQTNANAAADKAAVA